MNVPKLKGLLVEMGLNVEWLADEIGMDRSTLYRKLRTPKKLTIGDMLSIAQALKMNKDQACSIFLPY